MELGPRRSQDVRGSQELQNGGLRALLLDGRVLDTSGVVLGRLKLVPEGVELRPWRSLEVRGSPDLQNGGLRALEEAWDDFLLEAFSRPSSFARKGFRSLSRHRSDLFRSLRPVDEIG